MEDECVVLFLVLALGIYDFWLKHLLRDLNLHALSQKW